MRADADVVWDAEPAEQPLLVSPVADFWLAVAVGLTLLWALRLSVIAGGSDHVSIVAGGSDHVGIVAGSSNHVGIESGEILAHVLER